ncbi:DNA repair system protein [Acanthamoeba castellanii str. Neff]|uniref:DNA repair system protein n=1 Tax=Acanthamoeba castellanii (strain ATCC 30010 / Neff) TaxID=1257118 RepID=L8H9W1_ACACF|nr:DNA repair system protein [Acanthamoeba castellanii str. Neff]ELR22314.1 DNA repair system protein [Acanthamoeba castellanii str. Neff]
MEKQQQAEEGATNGQTGHTNKRKIEEIEGGRRTGRLDAFVIRKKADTPKKLKAPSIEIVVQNGRSVVTYEKSVLSEDECAELSQEVLIAGHWSRDVIPTFGKNVLSPRLVCSFGDVGTAYRYSGMIRKGTGWPEVLLAIKRLVEERANQPYNYVLCNLYKDGDDYIGWHADKEGDIVPGSTIASVSLGAKRLFKLRHEQTKEVKEVWLEPGSLLLMKGDTQKHYKHCTVTENRINLTFRLVNHRSG